MHEAITAVSARCTVPVIGELLRSTGAGSLLDYGCGSRRSLLQTLQLPEGVVYEGYDPAVPEFSGAPLPAELVCCIDVLEHIEPNLLPNVLAHLAQLCDPFGFFTIHSGPAVKTLSDGRNAHLTQEGPSWWLPRLGEYFEVYETILIPQGFVVVVRSLQSEVALPRPQALKLKLSQRSPSTTSDESKQESAATLRSDLGSNQGPPMTTLKYAGKRIAFNTPNEMTSWRVKSIFEKEPHTVRWLESMKPGSTLVDVGANVGMYSIFSAVLKGLTVFAFEPESQNYALLNANIAANELSDRVLAFPLALSDSMKLDKLYLSEFSSGGSCHSFAEEVGFDLKPRNSAFSQGAFSVTLDQLVESGAVAVPDYIKIDVDGIEHKVLEGSRNTLANPKVKSVLVELNTHLPEHQAAITLMQSLGFSYDEQQVGAALRKAGAFEGVGEFIFNRSMVPNFDFKKSYKVAMPRRKDLRLVLNHVLDRVAETTTTESPFPHLVIDNVFPDDYYAQMLANFPTPESLRSISASGRVATDAYKERSVVLFNDDEFIRMDDTQKRFWTEFASWMYSDQFVQSFLQKFSGELESRLERILQVEQALELRGDSLLVNDQSQYAIGPHTDAPHRLVTFLFYLPPDASMRELGTSIYRPKDRDFVCWGGPHHPFKLFDRVATVEYLPNRLLAFPKTERSFHGVEPITRLGVNRQLLIHNVRLLNKTSH